MIDTNELCHGASGCLCQDWRIFYQHGLNRARPALRISRPESHRFLVLEAMCRTQQLLGIIPTCLDHIEMFRVDEPTKVAVMDPRAPFGVWPIDP